MTTPNLCGRTALVTGGNRGIGLAVVRALAGAGADVTFTARSRANADTAMAELGAISGVMPVLCDVTDRASVSIVLETGFDILINNAGIIAPIGRITDVSVDDWAANISVNLVAAFHLAQRAVIGMIARGGGTIVNVSSGAAHTPYEGWSAYCAGKAGLAMLTQSIHAECAGQGIRVFGFRPGTVDTDMQGQIRASGINPVSGMPRAAHAPASEPALAMVWLCTAAADRWVGQEMNIRDPEFRRACGLPPAGE